MATCGETTFDDGGMHKGYRGNDYSWSDGILSSETVIDVSMDINDSSHTLLEDFVKELIAEGIDIVFVKSPVYYEIFDKVENTSVSDSIFSDIATKYTIPILDYYHDSLSYDKSNFYNPSHLNKKGSDIFTIQLASDLVKMGLVRK